MELVYIWIKKFRNFSDTGINFSDRFNISYTENADTISIVKNNEYTSLYPDYITNVNAIVGKNSVGKTNLLDCIGLRKGDRNKYNEERIIKRKSNKGNWGLILDEAESITKNHIYFFIYYLGKDSNDKDLFCIEGNDVESFKQIFAPHPEVLKEYWFEKYWFAFVCTYVDGKFIYKYDINQKLGDYSIKSNNGFKVYGDYRSEQDKLAIISLRDTFSKKYYESSSFKPDDESYIMIPRRLTKYKPKFLANNIKLLHDQIINNKDSYDNHMYSDDKYSLIIEYKDFFLQNSYDEDLSLYLKYSYESIDSTNRNIFRLIESYIRFLFNHLKQNKNLNDLPTCKLKLESYEPFFIDDEDLKDYYLNLLKIILNHLGSYDSANIAYHLNSYNKLVECLFTLECYYFSNNNIVIDITKDSPIKEIFDIITVTIDECEISALKQEAYPFYEFFNYSLSNLSDGEAAYLGIFSGLYEQINALANDKEKYILTFDEPEIRMHPELARNFIDTLIKFLGSIRKKNQLFQIIIATHSPLLLSDIPKENIVFLEKENNNTTDGLANKCVVVDKDQKVNTFGQNIHLLFKNSLFVDSTIGQYARSKINDLIKSVSSKDGNKIVFPKIDEIEYKKLKNQINVIAEDVLRDKLLYMLEECFNRSLSDEEQLIRKLEADKLKIDEQLRLLKERNS